MAAAEAPRYVDARPTFEVADLATALGFWTDVCGLDVEVTMGAPPTFAILASGGAGLAVAEADAPVHPAIAVVYLTCTGLDGLLARFAEAGVEVVEPLTTRPWGLRDVVVRVPGGGPLVAFGEPT